MTSTNRFYFLDNLRVLLTAVVIAQHVGQAYGPTGGWWPIQEAARAAVLGPFFTVNRSFGMSLFFLIAGYFTALSLQHKAPGAFIKGRLERLGLPLLGWTLVMIPIQLLMAGPEAGWGAVWPIDVGHMWFVQHLIVFSVGYAAWWAFRSRRAGFAQERLRSLPGVGVILAFALGLAVVSAVVREWSPIDRWSYVLGFFRVAWADVPRDLSFFVIGTIVYRQQWLTRFTRRAGLRWLAAGGVLAGLCYAYDLWLVDVLPWNATVYDVLYPIWESVLCCALCIGLPVLFREALNVQNRLTETLAKSQYAAYIIHVLIVLLVQWAVAGVSLGPLAKFVLVTLACVPLVFLVSNWLRRPLRI